MIKSKNAANAVLAAAISAALLSGCNPPENESSPGVVSDTSSEVSTTESTESTEEISTVESTVESTTESTTPGNDEPTSEPTSGDEQPTQSTPTQPSSGSSSQPQQPSTSEPTSSGSQTSSSSTPQAVVIPIEPGMNTPEPPATTERKPKDENTNIYGEKSTGGWITTPGGTYWKEGSNFYRSKEDWLYGRNSVPQGEVDGENISDWNFTFN